MAVIRRTQQEKEALRTQFIGRLYGGSGVIANTVVAKTFTIYFQKRKPMTFHNVRKITECYSPYMDRVLRVCFYNGIYFDLTEEEVRDIVGVENG